MSEKAPRISGRFVFLARQVEHQEWPTMKIQMAVLQALLIASLATLGTPAYAAIVASSVPASLQPVRGIGGVNAAGQQFDPTASGSLSDISIALALNGIQPLPI
jgi:hypothetical protein